MAFSVITVGSFCLHFGGSQLFAIGIEVFEACQLKSTAINCSGFRDEIELNYIDRLTLIDVRNYKLIAEFMIVLVYLNEVESYFWHHSMLSLHATPAI
jgi:hypothetical protein